MDPKEYVQNALKTEHDEEGYMAVKNRLNSDDLTMLRVLFNRMVHITNQIDMLKKKIFYGSTKTRVLEELEFAKKEHGYLMDHLSSNHYTRKNLNDIKSLRLLHSIIGVAGEAGELADAFSKYLKSGKMDEVNFKEEFGDLEWYEAIGMSALGLNHEKVWKSNNEKLAARYGEKFSEKGALVRNLEKERKVLEKTK